MCYYNGQRVTRAEYIILKGLEKPVKNYPFLNVGVHNGFNYAPCAIAIPSEDGRDFEIVQAEWGYVPGFIKTREEANIFRRKYTTLNFKAENLFTKDDGKPSMWAGPAVNRRCLVLSSGIVESRHMPKFGKQGQVLKATEKFPYYVWMKDKEYFWFPGLYNEWLDPQTSSFVNTVAFGVTQADAVMNQIHNSKGRMPTFLTDELAWEWMTIKPTAGELTDENKMRLSLIAHTQIPSKMLDFCTVDSEDYRLNGKATPLEYPDLAPLDMALLEDEQLVYNHWPETELVKA
ncbi:SOS response-associated peptidase family protein [Mucilaginibacter aquariorum]|uniref:Abasic site processing protein n=1 Tax=Mucilaginibacter aquariorum TaxID=2967225 RepID=A0ABT1SXI3_9SPHI|nr:SOS response-associated peptidase family protein [Mucilaginibacter aquariorum]MCQ6957060.1 SOS response-associated peptidase [Mucilaginibacter aquariorum]